MRGLEGKKVIVTGGGGGLGTAICKRLSEAGCTVGVFDLNGDAAQKTADQLSSAGAYAVDISDFDAVKKGVAEFEETFGPTDVLVNNAGWDKVGNFLDTDKALWEKIVGINLWGPLHMTHAVASGMSERGTGKIITIASDAARVGSSGEGVYSACKGGMVAFSKTLARELARKNINVNVICPGPSDTAILNDFVGEGEMGQKIYEGLKRAIPFKRLGQPEDFGGIVAFLASEESNYITGQVISVSGGLTMAG
ncbi:glucose 1-dehydrogenase [Sneathiella limimaris]|uniref:glucose 1-dehydrogenase n=1 Tax=Sneathiella limimaris TaxID=1964213 RepID=UPI00146C7CEE|nr:glucose 1-dehydrogenase [Sneathiella limimaris]